MRTLSFILCAIAVVLALFSPVSAAVVDVGAWKDTQVVEGYSSSNYGHGTAMYLAGAASGSYLDERIWTAFKLADELPPGATITSAKLRLYCFKADSANTLTTSVHGSETDSWSETGITWSSQPTFDSSAISQTELTPEVQGQWLEWDVTAFVQAQYAGDGQVSLMVKAATEGLATGVAYGFDAREYSASLAPRLRIEYDGAWPNTGNVKIFHMNDAHSRLTPHQLDLPGHDDVPVFEEVGGAAYFAAELLEKKSLNPDSLVLDAGDISEGNPLGDLRGNGAMVDFYNLLDGKLKLLGGRGIDAAVVGNHDVRSLTYVDNLKNNAQYPVVSMNICRHGTLTPYFAPYVIVTVNGRKIGILGYSNDESSYMNDDSAAVIDVVKAIWEDTDSSTIDIKDYVEELRDEQGCDLVILLCHMGHSRIVAGDDALLEDNGGVRPPEVVVAGHWHSWTETAWQPAQLNGKALIVEAASYLQYLGELDVTGDGKYLQAEKYPIRAVDIVPDSDVQAFIDTLKTEYAASSPAYALDQVIGYSAVDLRLDKDKWWTMNEFPWNGDSSAGAWVCDAMVWKAGQLGHAGQLALQSGGGIRRDVPAGPVTYAQIYETYPWQDDNMALVQMTGREIWDYLEADSCGTGISKDWLVTAADGIITSITYQGNPISLTGSYNVLISEYMAAHDSAFSAKTATAVGGAIRQAVVDYTAQYNSANPMQVSEPRYNLDTELAGGFRAVVTMVDDSEREPYYEGVFVRLLSATDETLAHRDGYGLAVLVNADGSINPAHQFAETMLYRSHLGFADGQLTPGAIIEIWGEGGFYDGNPQLVEQEGIVGRDTELNLLGHDESLAQPEYHATISSFWDEQHENHFVTFYAEKTGTNTVRDSAGTQITVYQPGGYYTGTLPGNVGDLLVLTGVNTYDATRRIFRCATAAVAATNGYPPSSMVNAVSPEEQSTTPLTLTATAADPSAGGASTLLVTPTADAQVVEASPTSNYGSKSYLYVQSAASGYKNERDWLKFDLTGRVPDGATITGARLKLYNWRPTGTGLPVAVHAGNDSSWSETGITWNTQPSFAAGALDTQTVSTVGTWYSWDVSNYVATQLAAEQTNLSFVLKPVTESASTTLSYAFESKEWSDSSLYPVLEIDYEAAATAGVVTAVEFYYRFAADGQSWTAWTSAGTDTVDPWSLSFAYPNGYGYYQFYSVASDGDGNVELAPVLADATAHYIHVNQAPDAPGSPGIADGSTDVSLSPELSVTVSDPDNDTLDVTFYSVTTEGNQAIGTVNNIPSGEVAAITWTGLSGETSYSWFAVAGDGTATATSDIWSFRTMAGAPAVPVFNYYGIAATVLLLGLLFRLSRRKITL